MMNRIIMTMLVAVTMNGACNTMTQAVTATESAQTRVMTGNYYDYMVIETVDGNEWLLDDTVTTDNPYMRYDTECLEYVSRFHDSELVQVLFDTLGTDDLTDDVILTVRSIDHRYK